VSDEDPYPPPGRRVPPIDRVWELAPDADPYLCVLPDDLRYFQDRFVARPLAGGWKTPGYSVLNKSKKVADFTSWMIGSRAFLVTDPAKDAIARICGDDVEFLPFDVIKKRQLYAVNVLRVEECLDRGRTEFVPGVPGLVLRAVFKTNSALSLPPIFKAEPADTSNTYVTAAFGRMAVAERFTGIRLRDPAKNAVLQIRLAEEQNDFPGIRSPPPKRKL
jgi:hypothetical protein